MAWRVLACNTCAEVGSLSWPESVSPHRRELRAPQVVPGAAGGQLQERFRAAALCLGLRAGLWRRVSLGLPGIHHDRPLLDVLCGAVRAEPGHLLA